MEQHNIKFEIPWADDDAFYESYYSQTIDKLSHISITSKRTSPEMACYAEKWMDRPVVPCRFL